MNSSPVERVTLGDLSNRGRPARCGALYDLSAEDNEEVHEGLHPGELLGRKRFRCFVPQYRADAVTFAVMWSQWLFSRNRSR